jgi:hypothetical protein
VPTGDGDNKQQIQQKIAPILDKVAVEGIRAWLKAVDLPAPALSRAAVADHVATLIAKGKLTVDALETALIGFEEASDMRIYLLRMDKNAAKVAMKSLDERLALFAIPNLNKRIFAGQKTQPMTPVYAHIEGDLLRVKWAEQQEFAKLNLSGSGVETKTVFKRAVLIADFSAGTAELRLNPPENLHSYEDGSGHPSAAAYYGAYLQKARDVLGVKADAIELRSVIKNLVLQEEPRVIRIHIDNHTNQKNYKTKTVGPKADVRDDPDWQLAYKKNGHTWAWDSQSFYWLPKVSSGFLNREVYTHIDAEEGFAKVNADCSNDEVEYVVSKIRTY